MKKFQSSMSIVLLMVIIQSCSYSNSSNNNQSTISTEKSYSSLIKEGEKYYNEMKFKQAEQCFQNALKIKSTSEVYLNLFSTYMNQNLPSKAENSLYEALRIDPKNPKAHKLNAKFLFFSDHPDKINKAKNAFNEAADLGEKESMYYVKIINYLQELKNAILNKNYSKWYDLTLPDATKLFYRNKNVYENEMTELFTQLENQGGNLYDWEFQLPVEFYIDGTNIITKTRTFTVIQYGNQKLDQEETLLLISFNSGTSWYSVTSDKNYYKILNKHFNSNILNKVF